MEDAPRPLFSPPHRDSKQLSASADVRQPPPPPTPAGSPAKPIATESEGAAYPPPPREPSSLEGTFQADDHGSSCECLRCRTTRLDTLESSENFPPKPFTPITFHAPTDPHQLDTTSYGARFRHSGWMEIRSKVFKGLKRTLQTDSRVSAFAACGSNSSVWKSKIQERQPNGAYDYRYKIRQNCCHDRLCTPCANTRSLVIRESLMNQIKKIQPSFITLTLSGKDQTLVELVDRLYRHFKALRNHPTWYEKVTGGAAFLEIKYNDKARRWHPHLHIIADAKYIPKQDLSDAWRSISKDSFIVDIKRVDDRGKVGGYVTKYASKPLNTSFLTDLDKLDEAIQALKGRRLCLTFGSWYGTPLTTAEDADLADDLIDAAGYESDSMSINELFRHALGGATWAMHIIRSLNVYDRFVTLTGVRPLAPPGEYKGEE